MDEQEVDERFESFDNLPPHIIEKILSHCVRDRFSLKTVCKAFYNAIWRVFGGNFRLNIDINGIEYKKKISNILNISIPGCDAVRFSNVRIGTRHYSFSGFENILLFFEERGEFVKNLTFASSFPADEVQKILSHTKNLRKLSVPRINFDLSELADLKEIELIYVSNDQLDVFKLAEDRFKPFGINYRLFYKRQPAIPKDFFTKQSNLRVLKITYAISDEYLELITQNLLHLEELVGDFNEIHPEYFDKLARLQNLKTLSIIRERLKNLLLTDSKLQVSCLFILCNMLTSETARLIARKFPELTKFNVNKFSVKIEHISEIFSHFHHLEEAQFSLYDSPSITSSPTKMSVSNENLKALSIEYLTKADLKYLKDFPNLTKMSLTILNEKYENISHKDEIEEMFRHFPKLRVLCLRFTEKYRVNFDIITLINGNPNLELIYFGNLLFDPKSIKVSDLEKPFEISHIGIKPLFNGSFTMLFVTDVNVLIKDQVNFRDVDTGCGVSYLDFCRALKYSNYRLY